MGDIVKEREPLKDIVEPILLRRSQRLNGKQPSTESSETTTIFNSKVFNYLSLFLKQFLFRVIFV